MLTYGISYVIIDLSGDTYMQELKREDVKSLDDIKKLNDEELKKLCIDKKIYDVKLLDEELKKLNIDVANDSDEKKEENKKKIIEIFRDSGRLKEDLCKSVEYSDNSSNKKTIRYNTTKEDRLASTIDRLQSNQSKQYAVSKVGKLFSDTNVSNYLDNMYGRFIQNCLSKKQTVSEDEFIEDIVNYTMLCKSTKQVPTISGLCAYSGVDSGRLNKSKQDENCKSHTFVCNFYEIAHDVTLLGAIDGTISSNLYTFLSKNWYSMSDSSNLRVSLTPLNSRVHESDSIQMIEEQLTLEQDK